MSELIAQSSPRPLPEPRVNITIRPGTLDDIAFMDALQKKTTKQVGWMPTKQFEGKMGAGHVLVAEATGLGAWGLGLGGNAEGPGLSPSPKAQGPRPTRVGYLIGNDQYFKRDDVGIIYQINVVPEFRRSLVAASLLKAQFERSAYGCKLYCCWCAQDIEANRFWESMGFVALAFRAGGKVKTKRDVETKRQRDEVEGDSAHSVSSSLNLSVSSARVHIFWQKRIRLDDNSTPWWFPSLTTGGAIREDRLVLPIPPGTHWSDAKPLVLPGENGARGTTGDEKCLLDSSVLADRSSSRSSASRRNRTSSTTRHAPTTGAESAPSPGMLWFSAPKPAAKPKEKTPKPKRTKQKNDPRLVTAARELRDRYLDEVNAGRHVIEPVAAKYDVGRLVDASNQIQHVPLLEAA